MARHSLAARKGLPALAIVVLVSACWLAVNRIAIGATVSEGPLSPVANVAASFWNASTSGASVYSLLADSSCQENDSTFLYSSTEGASFLVRVAPGAAHNGKKIRSLDVAVCFRSGANAGAGFTPQVRLDGKVTAGSPLTANTYACQETVQKIALPVAVTKSDNTIVDVGVVKSGADTKTVRICSIRVTINYEDDPPPPPLPAVAKTAADLDPATPGPQSIDATRASWDITIDNTAAGAVARQGIVISDGHNDAVLESASPAGACGTEPSQGPTWTCAVAAGGTTVLRVSRPRSAIANACTGGPLSNFVSSATLDDGTALSIRQGTADSPVAISIPPDTSACDPIAVAKSLRPSGAATVGDPDEVAWVLSITNPATGLDGASVSLRDTEAEVVSGPAYSNGDGYCTGDLTSEAGISCLLPAGVSVEWTVRPAGTVEQECSDRTFGNVAQYRARAESAWVDLPGPGIVLAGNSGLCTRSVKVCLVVEDNLDGIEDPDGGQFRFGNTGNATTLVLEATEGGTSCGDMVVPAALVSIFQFPAQTGDRPGSNGLAGRWSGDAPGFPRAFTGESSCDAASAAETVAVDATAPNVTFCNRPAPRTRPIVIAHHYFPAELPPARPAITFSAPAILPPCTAADASDGASSTWTCLVPAGWSGQVDVLVPAGRVAGACPAGLEPVADYRSCSYRHGALSVRATFIEHGVPLADADIPVVIVDDASISPAVGPASVDWGPLPVDPLSAHAVGIRFDADGWRLAGAPTLAGEECAWGTPPATVSADVLVHLPPGGDCVVTFTLERLVASVTVHQLYLGATGDPPALSAVIDGVADAGTWAESGSPVGTWRKAVGIAGAGSAVTVTAAIPAGWAPVTAFPGDCSLFSGAPDPSAAESASITLPTVQPGDEVNICFVSVAVGSLVLVVNETHATGSPEQWTFATTSPHIGHPVITTPPNAEPAPLQASATRAFARIPVGAYAIRQLGGRAACAAGATATDFQTAAAASSGALPADAETAVVIGDADLPFAIEKGRSTYVRFDNAGCGTVLATGIIAAEVVDDLDGDGTRDPGETGIAGWPVEVSGPDGTAMLFTDSVGNVQFPVITGGAYEVVLGGRPGWRATSPVQVVLTAGLARTTSVAFFQQPRVGVTASMTEISLSHPAGAPGEGWVFSLEGCGQTRSATTPGSGTVTFGDLPPAIGCEFTVRAGGRPGWSPVVSAKVAAPAGPGETASLSFASVKVEVCLDCTPSPGPGSPGEQNPVAAVLRVASGSNLVTWPGGPAPVEQVFGEAAGVRAVYLWDSETGAWLKYFPGLPRYLSDLTSLTPGAAYWVISAGASAIPVPGTG